jgi:ribosome modulation factor
MRKNSKSANTIHALMHEMLQAIQTGNHQNRNRVLVRALDIHHRDEANGGRGYSLLWLCEIAEQYPAALDASPALAKFLDDYRLQRRALIRGKRDFTLDYRRCDNPYCCYTQSEQYECWYEGWDEAARAEVDSLPDEELEPFGVDDFLDDDPLDD